MRVRHKIKKKESKKELFTYDDNDKDTNSFSSSNGNECLNDSDLADQMDDFLISDRSIERSDYSGKSPSQSSDEEVLSGDEDESEEKKDTDAESKIYKEMEGFYDKFYSTYEVNAIRNIF